MTNRAIPVKDLRPVMFSAGAALQSCQQLEYGVKLLLYMCSELFTALGLSGISEAEATQIIEGHTKRTLGQLLRTLNSHIKLPARSATTLREALAARNFVVHHFFIEGGETLANPSTRHEAEKELKDLRTAIIAGIEVCERSLRSLYLARGLDFGAIEAEIEARVRAKHASRWKPDKADHGPSGPDA